MILTIAITFSVGLVCGVLLGTWLDRNDILYVCHRCGRRGGKITNAITQNKEAFSRLAERLRKASVSEGDNYDNYDDV